MNVPVSQPRIVSHGMSLCTCTVRLRTYLAKVHGKPISDEDVDKLMKTADADGDEVIDLEEFKIIMRADKEDDKESATYTSATSRANGSSCDAPAYASRMSSKPSASSSEE